MRRGYQAHRRTLAKRNGTFGLSPIPPSRPANDTEPVPHHIKRLRNQRVLGQDNEHKCIEAFASGVLPDWYISIRPATPVEDAAGVDVWVTTTSGDVAVQIKSSAKRASLFREKRPGAPIAVIVLHFSMSDQVIRERVLCGVLQVIHRQEAAA